MIKIIIALIISIMAILPLNGKDAGIPADTVACFFLKSGKINTVSLSRPQFIMSSDSLCYVRYVPLSRIEHLLHNLVYEGELEYDTEQFAMEWDVLSDSVISLKSMAPPVIALLLFYNPREKHAKYYNNNDLNTLIWITEQTVEIGNKKFRLSEELKEAVFNSCDE